MRSMCSASRFGAPSRERQAKHVINHICLHCGNIQHGGRRLAVRPCCMIRHSSSALVESSGDSAIGNPHQRALELLLAYPTPRTPQKAALVWSPAPDPHAKSSTLATPARPPSPATSGLVHWMSMMAEHPHMNTPHPPHDVHYMWNGVETKMNTSDHHHHSSSMQKGTNGSSHVNKYQAGPGSGLEDHRPGSMDSSQMHNMYGNHGNRSNSSSSNSPPVSATTTSSSMLVVPQPINAVAKPSLNAAAAVAAAANGSGRKYQCKMCPQIFGSKADLQLHTQIHMREAKPYKCSQCSKAFANSSYLSQHTRIHLGIKPYRCEICQRKFTQLSHLQQHIRTHTGDKPYKCRHPGCNKAFSQLSNLQSHSRCHQTDKPYKCNSCYKCFADEASLLEHIPKHKESKHLKTHICQYCGKSYTQETYLTKHLQKHAERADKRGMISAATAAVRAVSEAYWPKTSVPVSQADGSDGPPPHLRAATAPSHESVNESCLQPPLGDHTRLHLGAAAAAAAAAARDGLDHRHNMSGAHEHADLRHLPTQVPYDSPIATSKTSSSAFTPIQSGMIPISTSSQLSMPGSSRSYFPYEPISFPKAPAQVPTMDVKPASSSFPNQLISLHQIRNYATMPSMGSDHSIGIKEKTQ